MHKTNFLSQKSAFARIYWYLIYWYLTRDWLIKFIRLVNCLLDINFLSGSCNQFLPGSCNLISAGRNVVEVSNSKLITRMRHTFSRDSQLHVRALIEGRKENKKHCTVLYCIALYCIVSVHLYSASLRTQSSEALPVRDAHRKESSFERDLAHQLTTTMDATNWYM